jgi:ubiquinone/menaquinone biosynthesis C-methylase UbiE
MSLYNHKYFISSRKFQREETRLNELVNIIKSYKPESVLDVGCGIGNLVLKLREEGIPAFGIDSAEALDFFWNEDYFSFAEATKLPFKDKMFDIVVSTDFFEHIPEEDIDTVKSEMLRVGKKVLSRVAYEDNITKRQSLYHVTNKPKEWWVIKLKGISLI